MIEMNKKYRTRDGREVRVLCVDNDNDKFPVIAVIPKNTPYIFTKEGRFYSDKENTELDLIEVSLYDHIKKGDVVLVWDEGEDVKFISFFVEYKNNKIIANDRVDLGGGPLNLIIANYTQVINDRYYSYIIFNWRNHCIFIIYSDFSKSDR